LALGDSVSTRPAFNDTVAADNGATLLRLETASVKRE